MAIHKIKLDDETISRLEILDRYQGTTSLNSEIKSWLNENVGRHVDIDTLVKASLIPEKDYRLWNFSRSATSDKSYIFRFTNPDDLMMFKLRWH